MTIFEAIYNLIQAGRQALLDILQPLIMPDWGWLVTVILPLSVGALVLFYFAYLLVRYRGSAWANVDRRPTRLSARAVPPAGVHASAPSWWPVVLPIGFFFTLLGLVVANTVLLLVGLLVTLAGGWGWLRSANREWRRTETGAEHGPGATAHALPPGATGVAALPGRAGEVVPPGRALVPHGEVAVATAPGGYAEAHGAEPPAGVHMPAPSWWPVYASLAAFFGLLGLVVNLALLVGGLVLTLLAFLGWYVDSYRELKVAEGIAARSHVRDPLAVFPRILASLGALTVALSVVFAAGPSYIADLFPAQGPGASPGGPTAACTPESPIEITAKNTAFDKKALCLPAGAPFQLVFHNEDAIQHDVAIIDTDFSGEVFAGPKTETYDVPALAAGRYQFICIVHPIQMVGTAIVVASAPAPSP